MSDPVSIVKRHLQCLSFLSSTPAGSLEDLSDDLLIRDASSGLEYDKLSKEHTAIAIYGNWMLPLDMCYFCNMYKV